MPKIAPGRKFTLFVHQGRGTGRPEDSVASVSDPDLNEIIRLFKTLDWEGHEASPTFSLLRTSDENRYGMKIGRPVDLSHDDIFVIWEGVREGEPFVASCHRLRDTAHAIAILKQFYTDDPRLYEAAKWVDLTGLPMFVNSAATSNSSGKNK